MGSTVRLDVLKALGDNTRYAIYLELARSSRPLATADIADSLDLHPNTVRPHLERMRDVGLLDVAVGGRGDVGRPQHRYSIAPDAPSLGLEPPTMPLLASMVLTMARRLDADATDAVAVGEAEGRRRAARHSDARSTLEALVADLDGLGFDPLVAEAASGDPSTVDELSADDLSDVDLSDVDEHSSVDDPPDVDAVIGFGNCPFADAAREHPDLVCGLHRGLVEGFVAEMGDAVTRDFGSLTSRAPCRVTLSVGG